ncbi:MAG: GAF and ANTAR domain-containing protein, partial [Acidimicrobiales bacterium]|nr:GAF and ANTAR domain-containing protein [Acidimicrobiales bacterium]
MARRATGVEGASIMLSSGGQPVCSVSSGEVGGLIEDLQYTLGEGPGLDADRLNRPVLVPDLAEPVASRWLAFAGSALDTGVRAVFAFPLRLTMTSLGALGLYASRPGPLRADQHAHALVVAAITARAVLEMPWPLTDLEEIAEGGWDLRPVVHQAAGMVAAQLGIDLEEASVRLRAHAVGTDRPIVEVARDVVARHLRLGDHP